MDRKREGSAMEQALSNTSAGKPLVSEDLPATKPTERLEKLKAGFPEAKPMLETDHARIQCLFFAQLSRRLQDAIIARTNHGL